MFYPDEKIEPVPILTPAELAARLAPTTAHRERENQRQAVQDHQPLHQPDIAPRAPEQRDIYDRHPSLTRDIDDDERERTRSR
jgi:hypothetical protein